jgi:hypothetical protein
MGEDNFDDGETNFGGGKSDSLSFNSILMRHLERITRLASVEFKGGYSQQKTIPVAGTLMQQDVYVADTRECYINAIENLSDLLLPNFDEQMTKAEEECIAEIEEKNKSIRDDDKFKDEKRKIIRKLFRSISKFLNRKNYLEMGDYEDKS